MAEEIKGLHRWNFDATDDSVTACRGEHDDSAPCVFKPISPHEALQIINQLRGQVQELSAKNNSLTQELASAIALTSFKREEL